jgi:glyoxylase-like metal-dependent hydrolase (beta-lactamase superfamily II)
VTGLERVVPGVHGLVVRLAGLPYVNAFVVEDDEGPGVTIVDTGIPKRAPRMLAALTALGRRPTDVRQIVLTHHHVDHTGSVRALAAATGAPVFAHPADSAVVLGTAPPPRANRAAASGRLLGPILDRVPIRYEPPPSVCELADGDVLPVGGGALVVHTPGHTPGHVSLLLASKRLLIAGDAAACLRRGKPGPAIGTFTEDPAAMRASIAKLAGLEFDTACFGHGSVLRGGANAAFRRLVDQLASKG